MCSGGGGLPSRITGGVRRGEDRAGVREGSAGLGLLLLDLVLAVEVVVGVLVEG